MTTTGKVTCLVCGLAGLMITSVSRATLVTNPGFEDSWAITADTPTTTAPSGWTRWAAIGSGTLERETVTPYAGTNSLQFNSSTTVATIVGQQLPGIVAGDLYQISFWAKFDTPVNGSWAPWWGVDFGGTGIGLFAGNIFPDFTQSDIPAWTQFTITSTAVNTGGYLQFMLGSGSGGNLWIDDVSVDLIVPEPSTVMLLGLGGLLLWRRRKSMK